MIAALLAGCSPSSGPPRRTQADATTEPWYGQTLIQLVDMNRQALDLFQHGKSDAAAALIMQAQPLAKRLISVPRPTLAATEAASDLDQLNGQMLFSNRNYGWARLLFQKNLARWKYWTPRTPETAARLKRAQAEIADCDRRIGQ